MLRKALCPPSGTCAYALFHIQSQVYHSPPEVQPHTLQLNQVHVD